MRRHRSGHRSLLPAVLFSALFFASHAVHCAEAPADPWEGFNRKVYALNEFLDRNLVKPVAKVYQKVTPQIVDDGISNFFSNLEEVPDLLNHLLQLRMAEAKTFAQIASHLGVPLGTALTRMRLALEKLRRKLQS